MVLNFEIGSNYYIKYTDLFPDNLNTYIQVNGFTKKNSAEILSSFDVKKEFFTKNDIDSLATIYTNYNDSVDVIIAHTIDTTMYPIEIDPSNSILIPISIINKELSERLVCVVDYDISVKGINRRFKTESEMYELNSLIENKLLHIMKHTDALTFNTAKVDVSNKIYYVRETDVSKEEDERDKYLIYYTNRETTNNDELIEIKEKYKLKFEEYAAMIANHTDTTKAMLAIIDELTALRDGDENLVSIATIRVELDNTRQIFVLMLQKLNEWVDAENKPVLLTYEQYYQECKAELGIE